jgi:hypothetical protein
MIIEEEETKTEIKFFDKEEDTVNTLNRTGEMKMNRKNLSAYFY